MSTFTSRPSDLTVALLWGDRWWISGRQEPVTFSDLGDAAAALLANFAATNRPRRLRLLYQPPGFASMAVACPHGNRATLQAALQDDHPALADPQRIWGFEPIVVGRTLLHYEEEPSLMALVTALEADGVSVEGAWPLATALNLVPNDWPDTGALTVVAVATDAAVVFRHTPKGQREVESKFDNQSATLVAATLQAAFEQDDADLYLVALDDVGRRLVDQLNGAEPTRHPTLSWSDLVRAAQSLSLHQPNQLLPKTGRIRANRIVDGVTAVALASAVVIGANLAYATLSERRSSQQTQAAVAELTTEVEALRRNQTEAIQLRAEIAALNRESPHCSTLLRLLPHDLPEQIVLTRLRADHDGFTLDGGVAGSGLNREAWQRWLEHLRALIVPWHIVAVSTEFPDADFALKGAWR